MLNRYFENSLTPYLGLSMKEICFIGYLWDLSHKKVFHRMLVNTLSTEHISKITKNFMKKKQICELSSDVWAKPKRHQRHFFGLYFIRIYCSIECARSFCPSLWRRCPKSQFLRRGRNPFQKRIYSCSAVNVLNGKFGN